MRFIGKNISSKEVPGGGYGVHEEIRKNKKI